MMPGCPNPLLMAGASDPLDDLGVIARSLRFRASASARLSWTPATSGNRQKWTLNLWARRENALGTNPILFCADGAHDDTNYAEIAFNPTAEQLYYTGWGSSYRNSLPQFRDFAAYTNFQINYDSTQASENDRIVLSVNGIRQTFSTSVLTVALNALSAINAGGVSHGIGGRSGATADFNFAFYSFVDGQNLPTSSFVQLHPLTKQCRPKSKAQVKTVVDAGGANSFFLPFDDLTNTTTLCADASSKGNNWTPNNISLTAGATYDSMLDTPTNVFATLNAVDKGSNVTLSNGNLSFTVASAASQGGARATMSCDYEAYFEVKWLASLTGSAQVGIATATASVETGSAAGQYLYDLNTGGKWLNGVSSGYGAAAAINDIIGVRYKPATGELEFYKNNVSQGIISTGLAGTVVFPFIADASSSVQTFEANFGQRPFAYSLPGSALPLCTKNLARPPIPNALAAFVAVVDTGANVQATLAAARSTWGANYIEIFKRTDAAEGWRWRFFDDVANFLDSSSNGPKAAFPALTAGGTYVGYGMKVSPANGIATGRLVHTNLVADTVTDGLGNIRKMVILKNEATGVWYVYHPDLTTGKLLYLEQSGDETTDSSIGTVLSNSFVAAAALPSGTYRWIAFAEVAGFLKFGKRAANDSADGPEDSLGFSPALMLVKATTSGTVSSWLLNDNAQNKYNPANKELQLNATLAAYDTVAVGAGARGDFISCGYKSRTSNASSNGSGYKPVFMSIGAAPFRYANAQ